MHLIEFTCISCRVQYRSIIGYLCYMTGWDRFPQYNTTEKYHTTYVQHRKLETQNLQYGFY